MKNIFIILLASSLSNYSFSQEFLGVKVGGKKEAVVNVFKSKGFKVTGDIKEDVVSMKGIAASKELELNIVCSPISKTVWKFSVYFPEQSTWSRLKYDYEAYLKILKDKYGEPKNSFDFFNSPFEEGDGYEMTAVATEKCSYAAFWDVNIGISIKITKWKQVNISYENAVNSLLEEKERNSIDSKVF